MSSFALSKKVNFLYLLELKYLAEKKLNASVTSLDRSMQIPQTRKKSKKVTKQKQNIFSQVQTKDNRVF